VTREDYDDFAAAMHRLVLAYRLRVPPEDLSTMTRTYFRVLECYALADVLHAGRTCLETSKTFPKVADWLAVLTGAAPGPPPTKGSASPAPGASDVDRQTQAAAMRYQDRPCECDDCTAAGVANLPIRFVPTLWADGSDERAYNPRRQQVEIVGHWAHGEELRRWYDARAAFFEHAKRFPAARKILSFVREPGEEG
jgi:hypothetical protein